MSATDRPRRVSPYRLQLLASMAIAIAVLVAVWLYLVYGPLTAALERQQHRHLEALANIAAVAVEQTPAHIGLQDLVQHLSSGTGVRLTVVAGDGTVLADSQDDPDKMENHRSRPEIAQALQGQTGTARWRSGTTGHEMLYVAVPAVSDGLPVAVRVSEPVAKLAALATATQRASIILLLAAVIFALAAAWRLIALTAEPVERLVAAAQAMARGDLNVHLAPQRGTLQALASSLADLRDQLRERISALERERSRLQEVIDGLSQAVLLVESGVVRVYNEPALALFGTPGGTLASRAVSDLRGPESLRAGIAASVVSGQPSDLTVGPTPDQRSYRVRVLPLQEHAGELTHLIVVTDVTESARLESVRRDLIANASHELKTPATSILLLAESAAAAASDGDTDQTLAFISNIHAEAERLRSLVMDLLDLSRLETEQASLEPVDVRTAIDLALAGHRRGAESKGLDLQLDLSAVKGMDVYARCDPTDLAIALDNVLANAVAYTERGSVTVRLRLEDGSAVIEVADTGIGIPAEHLPRVFERFYRVDTARSRASGGTGLGLSLVKHAMERCGGSASIRSEVGVGTTVTLTVPSA